MSIETQAIYKVRCDKCKVYLGGGDSDVLWMETLDDLEEWLDYADWTLLDFRPPSGIGAKTFCDNCSPYCLCGCPVRDHDLPFDLPFEFACNGDSWERDERWHLCVGFILDE